MSKVFNQFVLNVVKSKKDEAKTIVFANLLKQVVRDKAGLRAFAKQFVNSYGGFAMDLLDTMKEEDPDGFDFVMRAPEELFSGTSLGISSYPSDDGDEFYDFCSAMYDLARFYPDAIELIARVVIESYKAELKAFN